MNNGQMTIKSVEGDTTIVITGSAGPDGPRVEKVTVTEGDKTQEFDGLDKVPEAHRATVEKLLSGVRIRLSR
jgi:hypothetical protein